MARRGIFGDITQCKDIKSRHLLSEIATILNKPCYYTEFKPASTLQMKGRFFPKDLMDIASKKIKFGSC